jgi:hypothetical protein
MLTAETKRNVSPHKCCECGKVINSGLFMNVINNGINIKYQCLDCKRKDEGWNKHYKCFSNGHHVDYEKCDEDFI